MNHEKTESFEIEYFRNGKWRDFWTGSSEQQALAALSNYQRISPQCRFRIIRVTTTREVVE